MRDNNNEKLINVEKKIISIGNDYIYYTQHWKQKNSKTIKRSWWANKVINV